MDGVTRYMYRLPLFLKRCRLMRKLLVETGKNKTYKHCEKGKNEVVSKVTDTTSLYF